MNKIHQLSQQVISKIAAGEAIERPAYVVKELIENSLDAGADSISVTIEDSGFSNIMISDNGEGMSQEDLKESFKPHTTSKLLTIDDLQQVRTLGFRGEALASIAAISTMTIHSKTKTDLAGTSVFLKNSHVEKISPIGMPSGTTIRVRNLFHALPVRKKFLKSRQTEFRHILETVMHFALAHHKVQFGLTHNGRTIIDLPRTEDVLNRLVPLLGRDITSGLIPLTFRDGYIKVSGFVTKPQFSTKTPYKNYLFINSRKISDSGITQAIKHSFGTLLAKGSYPICLVFISMPHEAVDVNIHPRKDTVRFMNQTTVYDTVMRAVTQTLTQNNLTFSNNPWEQDSIEKKSTDMYAGKFLKAQKLSWNLPSVQKTDESKILQIHDLYLLVQTSHGLMLIDQHAAHERIQYEQLLKVFQKENKKMQIYELPKPYVLDLNITDSALLDEYLDQFTSVGFTIEHFRATSYLLRSVPLLLKDRDYTSLMSDMLEDLRTGGRVQGFDTLSRKMLKYLACRSAIKAGDSLTKKQSLALIKELEKTENNTTCPHGRPTKVIIDLPHLNKLFNRH